MDSYNTPASAIRKNASSKLKDCSFENTYLQKRLNSVRKQNHFLTTPQLRRLPQCSQLQENLDPQKVAFLLQKQWTLYSLTPLHKFSYSSLKEYSRLLGAFIAAEKQKGIAVEVGEDFNFKILSKSQLPAKGQEEKVLWSGWFCCAFGDSLLETVPEDFTCLPLFLTCGAESNTALIRAWFQKTFDCYFSPLSISAFHLSWLAAMWTACSVDPSRNSIEFLWSVPCSPQCLDISYAIHPEDAKALWDSIHQTPEEVTQEEVDIFMDCLTSHFYRHFRIHLTATRLVRVSTPIAAAHTDGKIKILCQKYLLGVLTYLTELAIFQIE
ncbi:centromere protein L isoform X2 [Suncus etruscus]|uniref:centromere protein L isoform X2 n=1 Tax=Suncus etruscus TaxID=109475 RepID=UPI00210FFF1D|nr:centromere protein L isoform X2 [Suncus etruscus]